jgi:hypothetical protein
VFGGNFAIFRLWPPELFGTEARATAFAFCTSVGRFNQPSGRGNPLAEEQQWRSKIYGHIDTS